MRVPQWLTLAIAVIVMIFGGYRLWLATRKQPEEDQDDRSTKRRKGFYGMSKKTHLAIGVLYMLLAAGLIATSLGFNPFSSAVGPDTAPTTKDTAPSPSVPADGVNKR
jgi:uncharacterized iron-regulated membrane protein